jgi:hypothetical protein
VISFVRKRRGQTLVPTHSAIWTLPGNGKGLGFVHNSTKTLIGFGSQKRGFLRGLGRKKESTRKTA